jgi:hypothetical protein
MKRWKVKLFNVLANKDPLCLSNAITLQKKSRTKSPVYSSIKNMCGPKQPNDYTRVLMLIIPVLTQQYHINYRPGMASLYLIKCQLYTKCYLASRSVADYPQ